MTQSDLRDDPLYKEAEALYKLVLEPGSGRPSGAIEPVVSPDGRWIAFTASMLEKLEGAPTTRICMADLRSGDLRIVSFGPGSDLAPKFSPDGSALSFRSDRAHPGNYQIYTIELASGKTRAMPAPKGWVEYYEYSPDGKRILLGVAGHGADISGAQGAKTSTKSDADQLPSWMPTVETDDEAFKRRSAWILDIRSGSLHRASADALNVWESCWCGNEAIAAIVSEGASEEAWYRAHLVRIEVSSGKTTELYRPKDQIEWLSGSVDGTKLAFVEAVCSDRWIVAGGLRVIDLRSCAVQPIDTRNVDVGFTVWRNNERLLIAGIRDFETVVADIDVESRAIHERWVSSQLYCQNFFYPAAGLCPDGEGFVISAAGHTQPAELLHICGGTARKVLGFNHEGSAAIVGKLRPVEPYRWNAPDGKEIHGWLMRGRGEKPAALVMDVHGGPIWRWPPFFLGRSAHYVMLAERGYALFWPNPRGSSGRGQDFARQVVGDMGGADTQDYLSGLDQLVADGIADPTRVGVTGGSYGGFMSSWLITQDQRFAAAVPVAPVTNWVSQHLTSNIPYFDTVCLGSSYTDANGNHYRRSPVMFAQNVKTPTLLICGALDRCTPPGQAQEFHHALLQNGVNSVLVTYPHEGHGVRSFPAMIDFAARLVDWFTRHMPGETGAAGERQGQRAV